MFTQRQLQNPKEQIIMPFSLTASHFSSPFEFSQEYRNPNNFYQNFDSIYNPQQFSQNKIKNHQRINRMLINTQFYPQQKLNCEPKIIKSNQFSRKLVDEKIKKKNKTLHQINYEPVSSIINQYIRPLKSEDIIKQEKMMHRYRLECFPDNIHIQKQENQLKNKLRLSKLKVNQKKSFNQKNIMIKTFNTYKPIIQLEKFQIKKTKAPLKQEQTLKITQINKIKQNQEQNLIEPSPFENQYYEDSFDSFFVHYNNKQDI